MELINRTELKVRFSEVDPLGIVWHGNYVKYFEDGREAFGMEFGLDYLSMYKAGLITPIVKLDVNYKKDLKYGESAIVETIYVPTPAAKLQFSYKIYKESDNTLITTGSTTQVFLNESRQLLLVTPPLIEQWKQKWNIDK